MDNIMLKELNEYYNKIENKGPYQGVLRFYSNNLEFMIDLSVSLYKLVNNEDNNKIIKEKKDVYVEDINYELIEKVLYNLPTYIYNHYNFFKYKNALEIKRKEEGKEEPDSYYDKKANKIILVFKNNYHYICELVHEIMHATNTPNEIYAAQKILTEFISIYFENYTNDSLPNMGINSDEIDYFERLSIINKKDILPAIFLLIKSKYGEISMENLIKLNDEKHYFADINDYEFDYYCDLMYKAIKLFEISESRSTSRLNNSNDNLSTFKWMSLNPINYLFNTALAFYARENMDMETVEKINDTLIHQPGINIYSLFMKYNIKLDDDFIKKTLNATQNHINEHNKDNNLNI